jgi:hypothetical protein
VEVNADSPVENATTTARILSGTGRGGGRRRISVAYEIRFSEKTSGQWLRSLRASARGCSM